MILTIKKYEIIYIMNFQEIVVTVAAIILLLMLVFIGYILSKHRKNQSFPPASSECPDFWTSTDEGCKNPKNLGTCGEGPIDFSHARYKGHNGPCNKARWARTCNVVWNGITNNSELNKCR